MKAYVILRTCERTEFETLLFDADEVIEYLNKNQSAGLTFEVKTFDVPEQENKTVYIPYQRTDLPKIDQPLEPYVWTRHSAGCKTWEDCSNPFKDCIGCPLMFSGGGTISSTNYIKSHLNTKDSVLCDTVRETYTGDTQNSSHQAVTGGCSNYTTNLGSLKDSNPDDLDYIPNKK